MTDPPRPSRRPPQAAVFLDRDGVVNRAILRAGKPYPPDRLEDLDILPGVPEAIAALRSRGFLVVIVTNQPDVATGRQERAVVEAMHESIARTLGVDDIRVCYHTDADGCACRKPLPGMLLDAARDWNIDLARSHLVGDRWRDIAAGRAAGCSTYLIDGGYAEPAADSPDHRVASLAEAARIILATDEAKGGSHVCP
ncbi:HAD family hydrolase [Azospirillum cavernae]|uniref:D,D-heptose 1,7-bisphosphate phosphatase n=1 Tax=Azospirillum cavernae TaxID=2320860 RepID=A0A418VL63_9PROT|nr:HAD family hydrolase [Azospirillum cavernae]